MGNIKILPEIPSITAEAKRLKNKGVNILIALGHSGFDVDKQIAEEVDDIDLVVGGHTNTFLFNGEFRDKFFFFNLYISNQYVCFITGNPPDIEEPVGPYPFLVKQPRTNREVPVIQASHITKYLGKLWLEFDEAGELIRSYGNPVLLDYTYGQGICYIGRFISLQNIYGSYRCRGINTCDYVQNLVCGISAIGHLYSLVRTQSKTTLEFFIYKTTSARYYPAIPTRTVYFA